MSHGELGVPNAPDESEGIRLIKGDLVLPVLSNNEVSQEVDLSLASLGSSVEA